MDKVKSSELHYSVFRFSFLQLLIMHHPWQGSIAKATPLVPTPHPNPPEPVVRDQTPRTVGSGLGPLEVARQCFDMEAAEEPGPQRLNPLEDFQLLFPLVDPSSPGLPYALLLEYLFRCKRCNHVAMKSRADTHTHLCPRANGRVGN